MLIAAANGNEDAVEDGDKVASTLSSMDRIKANQTAERYMKSFYNNCDSTLTG